MARNGGKKHSFGGIILLIIIIIILLILGAGFGLGLGKGKGDGNSEGEGSGQSNLNKVESSVDNESADEKVEEDKKDIVEIAEDAEEQIIEYSINVIGSEYMYDNQRIDVDSFIDIVESDVAECVVHITEDDSSLNAYRKLIKRLKAENIKYIEE